MQKAIYHSHTHFCDGRESPELMLLAAIEKGIEIYSFTGHGPVPFPSKWNMTPENCELYFQETHKLKSQFKDEIQVLVALELDLIPGLCKPSDWAQKCDFTLGGVHYLGKTKNGKQRTFDGYPGGFKMILEKDYRNDHKAMVKAYWERVRACIADGVDVIAHLDLIKKFNAGSVFFNEEEQWYRDEVEETLMAIKKYNTIVEVNSRGYYRGLHASFYPSNWILKRCLEMHIPVHLSCDAHTKEEIGMLFQKGMELLKEIGFEQLCLLKAEGRFFQDIR